MLALLFVSSSLASFIDTTQCTRSTTLQFRPSTTSNDIGNWTRLYPPSPLYYSANFTLRMESNALRLIAPPLATPGLAAVEYWLPAHSGAPGSFAAWLYEIEFQFTQNNYVASHYKSGIGPWHLFGFDWGARGSTPNATAIRFSNGSNQTTDSLDVRRPLVSALRLVDNETCSDYYAQQSCAFGTLSKTTTDTGDLHTVRYQFVLSDRLLYPARIETDLGTAADPRFLAAAIQSDMAWTPPTRLVFVCSVTSILVFSPKISRVGLLCPTRSTTSTLSTVSTSALSTGTTAAPTTLTDSTTRISTTSRSTLQTTPTTTATTATDTIYSTRTTESQSTASSTPTAPTAPTTPTIPTTSTTRTDPTAPTTVDPTTSTDFMVTAAPSESPVGWLVAIILAAVALTVISFVAGMYAKRQPVKRCCADPVEDPLEAPMNHIYGPVNFAAAQRDPVVYEELPPPQRQSVYDRVPSAVAEYERPDSVLIQ